MKTALYRWCIAVLVTLLYGISAGPAHAVVGVKAWAQRFGSTNVANNQIRGVSTDSERNSIVVGYSDVGVTGKDMLIIKYSNNGVALWTNRYNSPWNGDDVATVVTTDTANRAFVSGYSLDASTLPEECVTIAYSSAGVPLWTNRYRRFTTAPLPRGIVTDADGDVVVAGSRRIDSVNWGGYETIKYSAVGMPLWTNLYLEPATSANFTAGEARALAVDSAGNVLVTGSSSLLSVSGSANYATVKYSSSGIPLWTNRYNGPGSWDDLARSVAVDNNGNVFVTGYSYSEASFNAYEYATVAYSNAGAPLWTNRHGGSGTIGYKVLTDSGDNVVVIGMGGGMVKYSNSGLPLWTNGAASGSSGAIDGNDDIVITSPTAKYSSAGSLLWTNAGGNALAIDEGGNVVVTSYPFNSTVFSSAGVLLWTNSYSAPGNAEDVPQAVAVDNAGNVVATGYTRQGSSGYSDYVTVKFSPTGNPLWTNFFNGSGGDDQAVAVAVDANGNVFVTGTSYFQNFAYDDFLTIKYSDAGEPQWTNRFNSAGNDRAVAIALDNDANVFVTGASETPGNGFNYATIKYSNAGAALWTNRYNGPGNNVDYPTAMAIDSSGNVFVTGYSYSSTTNGSSDYATIKYSNDGVAFWTNRYNGPGNNVDYATALAVDSAGNVIVTGYSYSGSSATSASYATVKYSSAGVALITNRYSGGFRGSRANAVAVDANDNIFVTGHSSIYESRLYYTTIKYSSSGLPSKTNYYTGFGNDNVATGIVVDGDGNVFVSGYSIGSGTSNDVAIVAYSNDLTPLWTNRYNGPAKGDDQPLTKNSLALCAGGIVVACQSDGSFASGNIFDWAILKYVSVPSSVGGPFRDGDEFVARFSGMPGGTSTIEFKEELAASSWQKLRNVTAPTGNTGFGVGVFELRETVLPVSQRFYRITSPAY
jgi:uncharacterized delta-60 repeat protein